MTAAGWSVVLWVYLIITGLTFVVALAVWFEMWDDENRGCYRGPELRAAARVAVAAPLWPYMAGRVLVRTARRLLADVRAPK